MIRCAWCGAQNYKIDMWCNRCSRHLDWAPPPKKRRGFAALSILAPLAAAVGVVLALALPAASWFSGQRATPPVPELPKTALLTATPSVQAAPTPSAEASPTPEATTEPETAPPDQAATPAPTAAPVLPPVLAVPNRAVRPEAGDPAATVSRFYSAVSAHQFGVAASLWTDRMQSIYPPAIYIDHRFSATQRIDVASERVIADSNGVAVVSVDVVELIGGETRRWVGTWQLIHSSSGWLLNQPNLRAG
jgi:hypothetical protein